MGLEPTCEAENKQTDIVEFRSLGHSRASQSGPSNKPLLNRQGSERLARADVRPNVANGPTSVLFLPVFLHLFNPLVRICSDQVLGALTQTGWSIIPIFQTVWQTTEFCGEISISLPRRNMKPTHSPQHIPRLTPSESRKWNGQGIGTETISCPASRHIDVKMPKDYSEKSQ